MKPLETIALQRQRHPITAPLLGILAAAVLAACGSEAAPSAAMPAPQVSVATVLSERVQRWDEFTGRVAAVETVQLRPRVSGYVESVEFTEGQQVKKGQVLFVLDDRSYRAALDRGLGEVDTDIAGRPVGAQGLKEDALARPDLLTRAEEAPPPPTRLRVLSPFDPALRDRNRAERLFGFFYRIEVFVPEAKRQYGYYVFPVLEGARLIGRIDVKADRDGDRLAVRAFWAEAGVKRTQGRLSRLESELDRMAAFAGVSDVTYAVDWLRV